MAKQRVFREPVVQPQDQSIKLIPLTKGQVAIVDAVEYDRVIVISWCAQWNKTTKSFYARASHGGPLMHRFIFGATDPKAEVDHKNGDTLDNRRDNLRDVTRDESMQNRGRFKNNKSGHTGVIWKKRDERWEVYINTRGKRINLGYFKELQAAIDRRKSAEIEFHGEFAFSKRKSKH